MKKELKDRYRSINELESAVFCIKVGLPIIRYVAEKEINKVIDEINYEEEIDAIREGRKLVVLKKFIRMHYVILFVADVYELQILINILEL